MNSSHVEFYRKHNISPVRQDIQDLDRHFRNREFLYRQMGILPMFITGKRVIEVGPGSGFNSVYTASLRPARYVLMEPNRAGVSDIRNLFSDYPDLLEVIGIEECMLSDYRDDSRFDFVFCEGVLSGVPVPGDFLRLLSDLATSRGIRGITCGDDISYFAAALRRFFAQLLIDPASSLEEKTNLLLPIFLPHLANLKGMNRRPDDWIIDNLINPASIGRMLSIAEAIEVVEKSFDIYGSSPHFIVDWRWYKEILHSGLSINENGKSLYWQNVHNFLDHSHVFPQRSETENRKLLSLCRSSRDKMREFENERNQDVVSEVCSLIGEVISNVSEFSTGLADALREALDAIVASMLKE
jgi:hypothetical protein